MSVYRRDGKGRVAGVRCDWCGKIANNENGEYDRPVKNQFGVPMAGYIRQPSWTRNEDGSEKDDHPDARKDICDECEDGRCPECGSKKVVHVTPTSAGPDGWGGRCKACGHEWSLPTLLGRQSNDTANTKG